MTGNFKENCIVITGGVAVGKSTVCNIIRNMGYVVIDADILARKVVEVGSAALHSLAEIFGREILAHDNSLDRKKLRKIIFSDELSRKKVESILHPAIDKLLFEEYSTANLEGKLWFYEASLVIENKTHKDFKEVWVVRCSDETQSKRIKKRALPENIVNSQMPQNEKVKYADFIIDTDQYSIDELVDVILKKLDFDFFEVAGPRRGG